MQKKKILIIDDSPTVLNMLKSLLEIERYKTITADTGKDGVKKAISAKPDLVILDTLLPDIDGFEVCRRIRHTLGTSNPKIIMMTGSVDAVDAVKARQMGADDYVVKTQDYSVLMDAIKENCPL